MSEIIVYGTAWCPDCISAKRFLITNETPFQSIDVEESGEAETRVRELQGGYRRIPTIVFPDGDHLIEPTHQELAQRLGVVPSARREHYDLVIVGGGPAGLSAAVYAGREQYSTLVVDAAGFGGQAVTTKRIDNYPGFPDGLGGGELAELFIEHGTSTSTELLSATAVDDLQPDEDQLVLSLSNGQSVRASTVLITTGTTYRTLGVPGEAALIGRGIHFCSTCDGPAYRGRRQLVVIGGGNSACEEALYLASLVDEVVMLQNLLDLTADAVLRTRVREHPNISVRTEVAVTGFSEDGAVEFTTPNGGGDLHPDAVFVFIGLTANTAAFSGGLDLDTFGFIRTDSANRTSLPRVFAAGDVRAGTTKQLASAAGDAVTCFLRIKSALDGNDVT